MLLPLDIILITNAVFVLILIIGVSIMIRVSVNYSRALGDEQVQSVLRWRIIRIVLLLFFTSLTAAIFNLLVS